MSLLSRSIAKLDTVVGELPPETRRLMVTALGEIIRNSAALGDQLAKHVATIDEKTQRRAVKALEGFAAAVAWQIVKGGGFGKIQTGLTNASAEAPHLRRALSAVVVDVTATATPTDAKGG